MLVPVLVIGGLVSLYIGTYLLNKRVPVPEECRVLVDEVKCTACHISTCSYKK